MRKLSQVGAGVAVVMAGAVGSACGSGAAGSPDAANLPVVVATTSIWADVIRNVTCEGLADIRSVIPIGGDPHAFEPSLRDRETLEGADLIVANGQLLEESLDDTIQAAEARGVPVFRFADGGPGGDPHVWFDPTEVAAALESLGGALVERAGLDADRIDACVDAYRSALSAVDSEVRALVASIPPSRRKLVTNHEALGYFGRHYGFDVLGAVIPSPSTLAEANPADLRALERLIEDAGVPAIFAEAEHSNSDVDALADSIGDIEVVTLFTDSLGPAGSGAETYVGLLTTDARLIAEALS